VEDPKARHGPYFSLTHAVGGKTGSSYLTAEQVGHEFRGHMDALWEACEHWADSQLANVSASSREAKKGGLQANLQDEIAQEIETLLGSQAVADLDFEAVEMTTRRQILRLAGRAGKQLDGSDKTRGAKVVTV
jgi:hypothetical protein